MDKISADAAAIAAATLAQAEITMRAASTGGSKSAQIVASVSTRGVVEAAYRHYLAVVTGDATADDGAVGEDE